MKTIMTAAVNKHGLVRRIVSDALDLSMEMNSVCLKSNSKGEGSFFIRNEFRDGFFEAFNMALTTV